MITRMEKNQHAEKEQVQKTNDDLLDFVFSWSFTDILNKNLFKDMVKKIPESFSSPVDYMNSFKQPLVEETHASLFEGLEFVGKAPSCEISHIVSCKRKSKGSKKLYLNNILTKRITGFERNPGEHYEPESGDLVLVTNVRLRGMNDLNTSEQGFVVASVVKLSNGSFYKFQLSSAKEIGPELNPKGPNKVYVTYLINMTTNMRIWRALNPDPKTANPSVIQKVLQYDSAGDRDCTLCLSQQQSRVLNLIDSLKLDDSQKNAVLSCIAMRNCPHEGSNVKLIWGPPGTGKTKTVASMLFALLKLGCKTLTCAPTNIAVLQVAERLMGLILASLDHDTYGLGDIVLFGNEERMKIDNHDMLVDVFLDNRVTILSKCIPDWTSSLRSMISLLGDPEGRYNEYVNRHKVKRNGNQKSSSKKKKKQQKGKKKEEQSNADQIETKPDNLMTFKEFVTNNFYSFANCLMFCMKNLYTHLPTSSLPLVVAKQMIRLNYLLKSLECRKNKFGNFVELMLKKEQILTISKSLQVQFPSPKYKGKLQDFCLSRACLVFCTASSSIKVRSKLEMVVIDEAAQLKECESVIPLQLPGVRNAVLIGDDRQLPAMVQSKVSENANFGRSLFQRLATLGKNKHLLNIQYRMHPTISLFPNKEFYDKKIVDGPNVKEISYERRFIKEKMYGSYSFINVARGKEDFAKGHSPRNVEEAIMVTRIIARLFKEHCTNKEKVSVGVISPYKGQVGLIEEKLGKKYDNHKEKGFSVSVRSVDGFQGGEEDIIIISTVRGNRNGSVGFLSNHQRTNVALTRARYCLWIVGNGMTLVNSGSVWKDLVIDAMTRGCFHNVEEGNPFDAALEFDFLEQGKTRWKVLFSDDFKISMASPTTKNTNKKVREMVKKLAEGWRNSPSNKVVNSELLEQYKVDNEQLYLVWSIDIVKEETEHLQVIKVWDILSAYELPKLAKKLDASFGKYTVDTLNRCKYKSSEGNLAVPMSWPIQSVTIPLLEANPAECLAGQLAAMKLST